MTRKRHPAHLAAIPLLAMTALEPAWPSGDPPGAGGTPETGTVIAEGTRSAITEPLQRVLRDAGALRALWDAHAAYLIPPPAPPAIDFSTNTIAAVFAGDQPTGGHALTVSGLRRSPNGWVLSVSLLKPGPGCPATQAITQPWLMVRVPGRDQSVRITMTESTRPCGD